MSAHFAGEYGGGIEAPAAEAEQIERLLDGKAVVTFHTASRVLGITEQHVRRLARREELKAVGTGRANRRITVTSIRIRRGY